jgi:hypothetical protein
MRPLKFCGWERAVFAVAGTRDAFRTGGRIRAEITAPAAQLRDDAFRERRPTFFRDEDTRAPAVRRHAAAVDDVCGDSQSSSRPLVQFRCRPAIFLFGEFRRRRRHRIHRVGRGSGGIRDASTPCATERRVVVVVDRARFAPPFLKIPSVFSSASRARPSRRTRAMLESVRGSETDTRGSSPRRRDAR